jgi:hypothetical protein
MVHLLFPMEPQPWPLLSLLRPSSNPDASGLNAPVMGHFSLKGNTLAAEKIQMISIRFDENFDFAVAKVNRYARPLQLYTIEPPQGLMGNHKVLRFHVRGGKSNTLYKVDGPGFLIDKLYEHYLGKSSVYC